MANSKNHGRVIGECKFLSLALGLFLMLSHLGFGQVFPAPHNLSSGSWTFNGLINSEGATRYPGNGATGVAGVNIIAATMGGAPNNVTSFNTANMGFYGHTNAGSPESALPNQFDIPHNQTFIGPYTSRVLGQGTNGVSFLTTGSANANTVLSPSGGYAASALVALNTAGRTGITVVSTARMIATQTYNVTTQNRDYALKLQYRVGTTGPFLDLPVPVSFNSIIAGPAYRAAAATGAMNGTLPSSCDNQPIVHVRWAYGQITGANGSRVHLGIDDITISSTAVGATPTVFSNPNSFTFPNTTVSASSAEQLLDVSGLNLGASFTVAAPTDFEVSLTSGSGFGSSVSISPTAGTVPNTTVYVRFTPGSAGAKSGNITIAGTGATSKNVAVSGTGILPITYYSKSSGNLEVIGTWGTNTDGTGSAPADFISSGQTFEIRNRAAATIGGAWTVSGASSKVVVGNGSGAVNFTVPSTFAFVGPVDVSAVSTLTLQNSTIPTIGTCAATSTVNFNQATSFTLPVYTGGKAFGNLILQGSTKILGATGNVANQYTVNGNMIVDGATVQANSTPFSFVILAGNLTSQNAAVFDTITNNGFTIITTGNGAQTFTQGVGSGRIGFFRFTSTKTAGSLTLAANSPLSLSDNMTFNYTGTSTFSDGGNTMYIGGNLFLGGDAAARYSITGTTRLTCSSTQTTGPRVGDNTGANAIVAELNDVIVSGGTAVSFGFNPNSGSGTITIKGILHINTGSGVWGPQFFGNTYNIGGNFSNNRTVALNLGTSTINFNGTGPQAFTTNLVTTEAFGGINVSKASGDLTFNDPANVAGTLTLTAGKIITSATNLITVGNLGTVTGGSATSYVDGPLAITGTGSKTFPIGMATAYRPVTLSSITGTAPVIQAEVINVGSGGSLGTNVNGLNANRYWTFGVNGGTLSAGTIANLTYGSDDLSATSASMRIVRSTTVSGTYDLAGTSAGSANTNGNISSDALPATIGFLTTGTTSLASAPVLNTPTFASVGNTTATLGATVASDGGSPISSRGIVWGFASNPTGNINTIAGTTGTFTIPVSGLTPGTLIYFRGFAVNGVSTSYSADGSFTTTGVPPVTAKVWNNAIGGAWTNGANWTPGGVPIAGDVIQFSTTGTYIVTGVPAFSAGGFRVQGGANVTLQAAATNTINVANGTGTDFSVASGSSLTVSSANALTIQLAAGATGSVSGSVTLAGGAHRIFANITGVPNVNLIEFQSGSSFTQGTAFAGNPFGTVALSHNQSVLFKNGSTCTQLDGSNPFGIGAPNSAITFETNSTFIYTGTGTPALSNRTYGNFIVNSPSIALAATGASPWSINNLTITAATSVGFNLTGGMNISGSIVNNTLNPLLFNPASAGTLNFTGASNPSISGTGSITFGANCTVSIPVGKTVTLQRFVNFAGGLTNNGILSLNGFNARISGNIGGVGLINGNVASSLGLGAGTSASISFGAGAFSNLANLTMTRAGATISVVTPLRVTGLVNDTLGNFNFTDLRLLSGPSSTAGIGPALVGASVTGTITAERYIPATGWHLTGTAIASQTLTDWNDDFQTQGPFPGATVFNAGYLTSNIYGFDQADNSIIPYGTGATTNGWVIPGTSALTQNTGYRIFTPAGVTLDNTGTYSTGPKVLTTSVIGSNLYSGYNLFVNPHLSAVNRSGFTFGGGIQNTILVWDPSVNQYRYDGTAMTGSIAGGPSPIASGQGFFVFSVSNGATITIPEAAKALTSGTFYRTNTAQNAMEIQLKNSAGQSDVSLFQFHNDAEAGYDTKYDAHKLLNPGISVYTLTSTNSKLANQALPFAGDQMVTPIGFKAEQGAYTFNFTGVDVLNDASNVYLKDNETGEIVDLQANPVYAFVNNSALENNTRFEFIFTNAVTSMKSVSKSSSFTVYPNPVSSENFTIATSNLSGKVTVEVLDMLGRKVDSKVIDNISNSAEILMNKPSVAGQYSVKVTDQKGSTVKSLSVK